MVKQKRSIKKEEDMTLEEGWKFRETDWELLIELYEEIFTALLEIRKFSITCVLLGGAIGGAAAFKLERYIAEKNKQSAEA